MTKVTAPQTWFDKLVIWCLTWNAYLPRQAQEELADLARQGLVEVGEHDGT